MNNKQGFWENRNVFVTGANGFLGNNLVKSLLKAGANVIGLCRNINHNPNNISNPEMNYTLLQGDLTSKNTLDRIINKYNIHTIFHLGGQTDVQVALNNPIDTFNSNIAGTWNVLESARNSKNVKEVIVASSDKAYGDSEILPYTENLPLQGKYPYDVSKTATDLIAQSYYHTYNLPVCITRCSNIYGKGDLNFNRLIPSTIASILNDKKIIIRSDGSFLRQYLYIQDAVEAYMNLAEKMAENNNIWGEAFNFSNDHKATVIDLVNEIIKISEISCAEPIILNEVSNEIISQELNNDKAKELLGWTAKSRFEESIKETIDWYREYVFKK